MFYSKFIIISLIISLTQWSITYANVIPAAIIRRHTVSYRDIPNTNAPIKPQLIYVPSSMVNLFVRFLTHSSKVHIKQEHKSSRGEIQKSHSEDAPHYLRHVVNKPVIQEIREVVVPYRQVIQEIKPVVEEVRTVVATGQPKSRVYMNFGAKQMNSFLKNNENFGYILNNNHESDSDYSSSADNTDYVDNNYKNEKSTLDNKLSLYDLSSIYGIKPTNNEIKSYKSNTEQNIRDNYGIADSVEQNTEKKSQVLYKVVKTYYDDEVDEPGKNNQAYNYQTKTTTTTGYNPRPYYIPNTYDLNDNYNTIPNTEPQYYVNYPKNDANSDGYYSDASSYMKNNLYTADEYLRQNQEYSSGYSEDLATSDGSGVIPVQNAVPLLPMLGQYSTQSISKSATIGSLAEMLGLPFEYSDQGPGVTRIE